MRGQRIFILHPKVFYLRKSPLSFNGIAFPLLTYGKEGWANTIFRRNAGAPSGIINALLYWVFQKDMYLLPRQVVG